MEASRCREHVRKEQATVNANEPLTEEEVQQLILTFWKMQEQKAHLVDLMEITAPDLEISMGEFAWHGYRAKQRVDPHVGHEV
jgi:hypothetical protein